VQLRFPVQFELLPKSESAGCAEYHRHWGQPLGFCPQDVEGQQSAAREPGRVRTRCGCLRRWYVAGWTWRAQGGVEKRLRRNRGTSTFSASEVAHGVHASKGAAGLG